MRLTILSMLLGPTIDLQLRRYVSLRANKIKKTKKTSYDWSKLIEDTQVRREYAIEVTNRFHALEDLNDNETADNMYNKHYRSSQGSSWSQHSPLKPKSKRRVPWENDKVTKARQKLKELITIKSATPKQENLDKVKVAKEDLDERMRWSGRIMWKTRSSNYRMHMRTRNPNWYGPQLMTFQGG